MTAPFPMPKRPPPDRHHDPATVRLPGGLVAAFRPLDPAAAWVPAWEALGATALVANPFYEAAYALAAAPAFGAGVRMLLIADRPPEEPGVRLLAAWPHRLVRSRWGVPLPLLMGWTHGYAPLGVPLIDAGDPGTALAAFLAAPGAVGAPGRLLLTNAPAEGPFRDLLDRAGNRQAAYWPHRRGMLSPASDPASRETYLDHLSGNRRRRLRRARRRLDASGTVTFELLTDPAVFPAALDAHIAREPASGKGRLEPALAQRPDEAAFLRDAVAALAERGQVRIARLQQGGRLLASAVLPLTGHDAFVLKVAHDDSDPAAAPGVQLVHRLTEDVLTGSDIARIDSCAPPGFELATLFWRERRAIAHLLVEAGHDPLFPVASRLERAREAVARLRLALRERREKSRG